MHAFLQAIGDALLGEMTGAAEEKAGVSNESSNNRITGGIGRLWPEAIIRFAALLNLPYPAPSALTPLKTSNRILRQ